MADRARLIGPISAAGARRVGWDRTGLTAVTLDGGNRLVGLTADGDSWSADARAQAALTWSPLAPTLGVLGASLLFARDGQVRVHPEGADLFLSSDGMLVAAHVARRRVEVTAPDGSIVDRFEAEHVAWHPDRPDLLYADAQGVAWRRAGRRDAIVDDDGERGALLAQVSSGGTRVVVWGQYGPFDVRSDAGALECSFPSHVGNVNLAAALGTTMLVTSGDDGRLVISDVVRGATHATMQAQGLVVRIDIDPTDHLAMVEMLDRRVMIIDIESAVVVEAGRAITHARWSPHGRTLACTDGEEMWLMSW